MYLSSMNERDLKQRTFGTLGFSLIAHAGLIAILVFSQQPAAEELSPADVIAEAVPAEAVTDTPIEVAENDEAPTIAANESEAATISEVPATIPEAKPVYKLASAKIAKKPAVTKPILTQPAEPEKLSPDIESPTAEQAELAAANADTEPTPKPKRSTKPTPTVIPKRNQAKSDDRAEATPPSIVSSAEQQPTQTTRTERSGAVVAAPSTKGSVSASTMSADETPTTSAKPVLPENADIRDADSLTSLSTKPFNYPASDRDANRTGTVFLIARIKADGSVTDIQIERSSGSKAMDQEAVKTFKQWKFSPEDEGYVRKAVQFVLKNDDADEPPEDDESPE